MGHRNHYISYSLTKVFKENKCQINIRSLHHGDKEGCSDWLFKKGYEKMVASRKTVLTFLDVVKEVDIQQMPKHVQELNETIQLTQTEKAGKYMTDLKKG